MDERARAGVEHLQAAAREMIAAGRALLDVAEELVEDPAMASSLLSALGAFVMEAARSAPWAGGREDAAGDDASEAPSRPKVQPIRVS